jgi:hypothetical protein
MGMNEMDLMHSVMLAAADKGCKIFRTNVGKIRMQDGRWFDTGLPKGHADLYGFRPDGQIFYIETKLHPRKPTKEQRQFLLAMIHAGAAGGVAYTVDEAIRIIDWEPGYKEIMEGALQYG